MDDIRDYRDKVAASTHELRRMAKLLMFLGMLALIFTVIGLGAVVALALSVPGFLGYGYGWALNQVFSVISIVGVLSALLVLLVFDRLRRHGEVVEDYVARDLGGISPRADDSEGLERMRSEIKYSVKAYESASRLPFVTTYAGYGFYIIVNLLTVALLVIVSLVGPR